MYNLNAHQKVLSTIGVILSSCGFALLLFTSCGISALVHAEAMAPTISQTTAVRPSQPVRPPAIPIETAFESSIPISDEAVRAEYERVKKIMGDKEYKVAHILLTNSNAANQIIARLQKGESFSELAEIYSIDTGSSRKGGDLGWSKLSDFIESFSTAVRNAPVGKFSEVPAHSAFGWHVIKVDEVRPFDFPFEKVEKSIRASLQRASTTKAFEKSGKAFSAVRAPNVLSFSNCTPEYPAEALRYTLQGTVLVTYLIDINGRVIDKKILKSSGWKLLDNAALNALSLCKFSPAEEDGKLVEAWTKLSYVWKLDDDSSPGNQRYITPVLIQESCTHSKDFSIESTSSPAAGIHVRYLIDLEGKPYRIRAESDSHDETLVNSAINLIATCRFSRPAVEGKIYEDVGTNILVPIGIGK